MATFVLVSGLWGGGWSWKFVVPLLRNAGHEDYPVTLTGLGDRIHLAHADIDLETHAQDVVNFLEYEDLTDVILVGWSYGGIVVTTVSHRVPERVQRVVILDSSLIPEDGQSLYDIEPKYRNQDEPLVREGNGWQIPPPPESAFQKSIPDADRRRWFMDRLAPQPVRTQSQPARLGHPDAVRLPHTLIRCTQAPEWSEEGPARLLEHIAADQRWEIIDIDGSHLAPIVNPEATARALMSVGQTAP